MRLVTTSSDDPAREAWAGEFFDRWYAALAAGEGHDRPDPASWRPEELRAELARGTDHDVLHWLLALDDDGTAAGAADVRVAVHDNRHVARLQIAVPPGSRRRGVGTRLLAAVAEVAAAAGCSVLRAETERPVAHPEGTWPGTVALRRWGFAPGLVEARRQLALPVPARTLDDLEAAARPHAAGYRWWTFPDAVPEPDVEAVAGLMARMSTDAPQGDLAVEPEVWDAARVRSGEALRRAQGRRSWTAVAADAAGTLVGYTTLVQSAHEPDRLQQWDTLVVAEHRGHRLGTLLKVAALRAAVADAPEATRVSTWNATSNVPMIAVNEAMGFRLDELCEELEAPVADVRSALAARDAVRR
ncbi:GNAT family N-acetyltransferase [Kineococcus rubinsiae]|uniref:GNAT family N-acetyltransferase n=1 Tax=Kineococcus rubinsiae TaxID=2609562 RepID=UPI0014309F61|nr:GNAT family N-acetyltransferase [Kineococcus rubinsiae]NIZ92363.1 GNAT family N-acetyltransferase [Kineococcus rubinsiae]